MQSFLKSTVSQRILQQIVNITQWTKFTTSHVLVELAWHNGSVMNCHAMARGSIPGWNGVFTELHVLRKGQ